MSYTGPQTFNTGMVLHMTQTMPNGYFDSYYLKIHRTAGFLHVGVPGAEIGHGERCVGRAGISPVALAGDVAV